MIFDIQRFSIHDGPGIRTLVFLKGCPLRCPWCSNPESQGSEPELFFYRDRCIGCERCFDVCPVSDRSTKAMSISQVRHLCVHCGKCSEVCYPEACVIVGKRMTPDMVFEEVLKDELFYCNSGGGITLGGGEPLTQSEFATMILMRCKSKGIHTAVETAGYGSWRKLKDMMRYTDLFLFDVKHLNSIKHLEYTGVDNQSILCNLRNLVRGGKEVIIRTPVIPGFNDTREEIGRIARYGTELGIHTMHLLPYHRYGTGKYGLLGRPYLFKRRKELNKGQIADLKCAAAAEISEIRIGG